MNKRTNPLQIERNGRFYNPPEMDDPKDEADGLCKGEGCKHTHFKEVCNVCGLSYGNHSGHYCPVGPPGRKIYTILGNFEKPNIKPAKRN
mmetsp:Transcript_15835/g.22025  ORF Transcript_15835/g.22025 Transcript_15835/m.22025 type:complete len:90 (-) Transcript_15835:36-305(-)